MLLNTRYSVVAVSSHIATCTWLPIRMFVNFEQFKLIQYYYMFQALQTAKLFDFNYYFLVSSLSLMFTNLHISNLYYILM